MVHASISKPQVVTNVLTSGYAGNLTKGQLAFVKDKARKGLGAEVVADFAGMSKKERIGIRIGEMTTPANLRIKEVANKGTGFFPMESILEISAHIPTQTELKVDHLEVGYDGINTGTGLFIPEGKSATVDLTVCGDVAHFFFGQYEYTITKEVYRAEGQTMQEVIRNLVQEFQEERVPTASGWASVTDQLSQFLEIGVIDSSNAALAGTDWTFSTVVIPDAGESNDLAEVQAQYPLYKVAAVDRKDGKTTYRILHPASVTLADVSITNVDSLNKGCADCLAGYDLVEGGVVYHVSLEDDGTDLSTTVDNLPGYVAGTVAKLGNDNGVGAYSIVLDDELTQAEIDTFLATNATTSTATIHKVGLLEDICFDSVETTYTWADEKTCKVSAKQFSIVLPDTECGTSRLAELQAAYPDLTIEEGAPTGNSTRAITLTGTSGTANININGVNYLATFDTDLATTAANFVTAHGAAITAATGGTVTSNLAVITYTDATVGFPTITIANATGNLAGTLGTIDYVTTAAAGGCKRTYSTFVVTDLVCEECADIYLQPFMANAPENFEGNAWKEFVAAFDEDAEMGIFVKGKPFFIYPEQYEEDFVPYIETSLKVKSMTFGAKGSLLLNYDGDIYDPETEFAESRRIQYAQDVHNDADALFGAERMGNAHFTNKDVFKKNLFARRNLSQERLLKYHKRYVQYAVKYKDNGLSQMGASRSDITHEFRMIVEYGKHTDLQDVLNSLAAKLGLETVNIL